VPNVGSGLDVQLGNVSHVFIFHVHVAYVARWVASAVFGKMAHLPTVEAGSFGACSLIAGLSLGVCGVVIFWLDRVCVNVVALVLASVIWSPGPGQVHWYLNVIICRTWCVGGVVLHPLLLLLLLLSSLLVLLGTSSPTSSSKLILVVQMCC
jgi:hypothetical protein